MSSWSGVFPNREERYYLMSIHEHLPPEVKRELKQVGWSKGLELAKLASSRNGQSFKCANWLHKQGPYLTKNSSTKLHTTLAGLEFGEPTDWL